MGQKQGRRWRGGFCTLSDSLCLPEPQQWVVYLEGVILPANILENFLPKSPKKSSKNPYWYFLRVLEAAPAEGVGCPEGGPL